MFHHSFHHPKTFCFLGRNPQRLDQHSGCVHTFSCQGRNSEMLLRFRGSHEWTYALSHLLWRDTNPWDRLYRSSTGTFLFTWKPSVFCTLIVCRALKWRHMKISDEYLLLISCMEDCFRTLNPLRKQPLDYLFVAIIILISSQSKLNFKITASASQTQCYC